MNNKYTYIIGKGGGSSEGSLRYDQPQELTTEQKKQAQENLGIDLSANLKREIVEALPATGEANIIYMVSRAEAEEQNVYDEYMYINNAWEKIGSTDVDLSNYYTKEETDELINSKSRLQIRLDDMQSIVESRSCTAKELNEAAYDGRDIVVYDEYEVTTYYYESITWGIFDFECNTYKFFNEAADIYIATVYDFETNTYRYAGVKKVENDKNTVTYNFNITTDSEIEQIDQAKAILEGLHRGEKIKIEYRNPAQTQWIPLTYTYIIDFATPQFFLAIYNDNMNNHNTFEFYGSDLNLLRLTKRYIEIADVRDLEGKVDVSVYNAKMTEIDEKLDGINNILETI